jgi:NAD-dependent dihydropyrimidine dehydrogenase PreA subunit
MYILSYIVDTLLRFIPIPITCGLITIGNPDETSPVFVTGNYHLTVAKVKKVLQGMDCYLLVANTDGINVWCAATGGHFTDHDVISVLKTSGIADMVDHRTVILPQLAAAGVNAKNIKKKTGWDIVWGPVDAEDIPAFLESGKKSEDMRSVGFPLKNRMEIGVAWAFPASIILGLIVWFVWSEAVIFTGLVVWVISLLLNGLFPVYGSWLKKDIYGIECGQGLFQGGMVMGIVVILVVYTIAMDIGWRAAAGWAIIVSVVVFTLGIDILGNTPLYKSGLHKERTFTVYLDENKCKGIGVCKEVCPKNCFTINKKAVIIGRNRCVKCGACIVQCPCDALYFEAPDHEVILPETVRTFKLNLMGKRTVRMD